MHASSRNSGGAHTVYTVQRRSIQYTSPSSVQQEAGKICMQVGRAMQELKLYVQYNGGTCSYRVQQLTEVRACFSLGCMSTRPSENCTMVVVPSALPTAAMRPVSITLRLVSG